MDTIETFPFSPIKGFREWISCPFTCECLYSFPPSFFPAPFRESAFLMQSQCAALCPPSLSLSSLYENSILSSKAPWLFSPIHLSIPCACQDLSLKLCRLLHSSTDQVLGVQNGLMLIYLFQGETSSESPYYSIILTPLRITFFYIKR